MTNKYTEFVDTGEDTYRVWNIVYDEYVGLIKKQRVGIWMHWCFFPNKDTWFSNGCLKEISQFITSLYSKR